ncbi:MAG: TRAP transporter small permease [Rhodospirillaceae bacterium]|nr:TRAP transporter small permease [Rhodospirillaceae bacterium]MYB13932.1 TRAP transporter small permease [Rhodospirillaceae bacterium]MYI50009.1 TRAP transporter small permease [Rhodospirillaceae bacterium]
MPATSLILDRFEAGFERVNRVLAGLVALSIGVFALLIPFDLFLRKVGWGNLPWLHEGAEYGLYVGVFLSAAWVLNKGSHVRVDIVIAALPRRVALRLERLLDIGGALLCLVLCYFGAAGMIGEYEFGTLPDKDLRIPNWYMLLVFAVSFALLAIEFLLRYRRAGREGVAASSEAGF